MCIARVQYINVHTKYLFNDIICFLCYNISMKLFKVYVRVKYKLDVYFEIASTPEEVREIFNKKNIAIVSISPLRFV